MEREIENRKSAVVIFTYRKIEFLQEILDEIQNYSPPKLYIFQNRFYNNEEKQQVLEVKEFLTQCNYQFPVELIFQKKHLKINDHFLKSINYAFSKEDSLIILEDDTVPSNSFFLFCNQMLQKYKDDDHVGCINGSNLNAINKPNSYFLTSLAAPFWGWATWKSKWNLYRNDNSYWKNNQAKILSSLSEINRQKITTIFNNTSSDSTQITWDVLWNWALMANDLKCIIPGKNLTSNKGFNLKGTTTNYDNSKFNNLKRYLLNDEIFKKIESGEEEVILLENKIIELYDEIIQMQGPRIYDDFSEKDNLYKKVIKRIFK